MSDSERNTPNPPSANPQGGANSMDRRDFLLATTAAAGAGLALGPYPIRAANLASNEVRVAIVGAGAQGQVLLDASLQIPNVRFAAVCDIWTEYNQRRVSRLLSDSGHPNRAYVDYKELLDKEKDHIDAVIVATPDFWHAEHAIACMKAGLQVYCEKEMSNNLADARRMVLTARETGKLLQIGHQRRSNPRYQFCYQRLINGSQTARPHDRGQRAVEPRQARLRHHPGALQHQARDSGEVRLLVDAAVPQLALVPRAGRRAHRRPGLAPDRHFQLVPECAAHGCHGERRHGLLQ